MTTIATIEHRTLSRVVGVLCDLRLNLTEAKSRHAANPPKTADYFYAKQTQFPTEAKSAPAPPIRLQFLQNKPNFPNPECVSSKLHRIPQKSPKTPTCF